MNTSKSRLQIEWIVHKTINALRESGHLKNPEEIYLDLPYDISVQIWKELRQLKKEVS